MHGSNSRTSNKSIERDLLGEIHALLPQPPSQRASSLRAARAESDAPSPSRPPLRQVLGRPPYREDAGAGLNGRHGGDRQPHRAASFSLWVITFRSVRDDSRSAGSKWIGRATSKRLLATGPLDAQPAELATASSINLRVDLIALPPDFAGVRVHVASIEAWRRRDAIGAATIEAAHAETIAQLRTLGVAV